MKQDRVRIPAGTGVVLLLLALLLVWRAAATVPDERLHITFLDVGSADAVLIKTPTGKHVLINGGPSVTTLADDRGRRLPAFNRTLDWLIVAAKKLCPPLNSVGLSVFRAAAAGPKNCWLPESSGALIVRISFGAAKLWVLLNRGAVSPLDIAGA